MATPWRYDPSTHRYRNATTGRFISLDDARELRDEFADAIKDRADILTGRMAAGDITLGQWVKQTREDLKLAYLNQYALGRGGFPQMKQEDYGSVGGQLASQFTYLDAFAKEIAAGGLSEAQVRARLRMYYESSTQAFERGKARAYGLAFGALDQYPGSGDTACLSQCRCTLEIGQEGTSVLVYWRLGNSEHCPDCEELARTWNPLRITID